MERVLTVEFGPSRSKRFRKAVEEARSGAGECSEPEPGRYRVRFLLGSEGRVYACLARLLLRVRDWRATEVYEGEQLVSSYHARDIRVSGCPKLPIDPLCAEQARLRPPTSPVQQRSGGGVTRHGGDRKIGDGLGPAERTEVQIVLAGSAPVG